MAGGVRDNDPMLAACCFSSSLRVLVEPEESKGKTMEKQRDHHTRPRLVTKEKESGRRGTRERNCIKKRVLRYSLMPVLPFQKKKKPST